MTNVVSGIAPHITSTAYAPASDPETVYLQVNPGNFAAVSTATALVVLSLDWLFFYYMPGYTGAALRYVAFVLPSAVLTIPAALLAFWLVQHIHDGFRIDNGVV